MSEAADRQGGRRLADTIREVKNAMADREDVVVELREAQRTRLELLAQELAPVFEAVPSDDERFDLVISHGLVPRLWIDMTAHVVMGRDRRTFRFLRDTRMGRVVLAEATDMRPVAEQVTRYIAERMVERERMMDAGVTPVMVPVAQGAPPPSTASASVSPSNDAGAGEGGTNATETAPSRRPVREVAVTPYSSAGSLPWTPPRTPAFDVLTQNDRAPSTWSDMASGLMLVVGGALLAAAVLVFWFWDRVS